MNIALKSVELTADVGFINYVVVFLLLLRYMLPVRRYGKRFPFAYRRTGMGRDGTGVHDVSAGRDATGL